MDSKFQATFRGPNEEGLTWRRPGSWVMVRSRCAGFRCGRTRSCAGSVSCGRIAGWVAETAPIAVRAASLRSPMDGLRCSVGMRRMDRPANGAGLLVSLSAGAVGPRLAQLQAEKEAQRAENTELRQSVEELDCSAGLDSGEPPVSAGLRKKTAPQVRPQAGRAAGAQVLHPASYRQAGPCREPLGGALRRLRPVPVGAAVRPRGCLLGGRAATRLSPVARPRPRNPHRAGGVS